MTQKHKERERDYTETRTDSLTVEKGENNTDNSRLKNKTKKNSFCVTGGSCHKYNFCRDKTFVFGGHKYACRDKHVFFFFTTKVLS